MTRKLASGDESEAVFGGYSMHHLGCGSLQTSLRAYVFDDEKGVLVDRGADLLTAFLPRTLLLISRKRVNSRDDHLKPDFALRVARLYPSIGSETRQEFQPTRTVFAHTETLDEFRYRIRIAERV